MFDLRKLMNDGFEKQQEDKPKEDKPKENKQKEEKSKPTKVSLPKKREGSEQKPQEPNLLKQEIESLKNENQSLKKQILEISEKINEISWIKNQIEEFEEKLQNNTVDFKLFKLLAKSLDIFQEINQDSRLIRSRKRKEKISGIIREIESSFT